ncbi:unnamed protein product [Urochloa humidicola]
MASRNRSGGTQTHATADPPSPKFPTPPCPILPIPSPRRIRICCRGSPSPWPPPTAKLKKPLTEKQHAAAEHAWPTSSSAPSNPPPPWPGPSRRPTRRPSTRSASSGPPRLRPPRHALRRPAPHRRRFADSRSAHPPPPPPVLRGRDAPGVRSRVRQGGCLGGDTCFYMHRSGADYCG